MANNKLKDNPINIDNISLTGKNHFLKEFGSKTRKNTKKKCPIYIYNFNCQSGGSSGSGKRKKIISTKNNV